MGVEMAAEVRSTYPDVAITLVTNAPSLIADKPPALGKKCAAWFEKNDVNLIFNDKVVPGERNFVTLMNMDRNIEADVVLWCVELYSRLSFFCNVILLTLLNYPCLKLSKAHITVL